VVQSFNFRNGHRRVARLCEGIDVGFFEVPGGTPQIIQLRFRLGYHHIEPAKWPRGTSGLCRLPNGPEVLGPASLALRSTAHPSRPNAGSRARCVMRSATVIVSEAAAIPGKKRLRMRTTGSPGWRVEYLQRGPLILGDSRESMRFAATEEWSNLILVGLFRNSGAEMPFTTVVMKVSLRFLLNPADS
jgi:hypothetical protein